MQFGEYGPEIMGIIATRTNPAEYADLFTKELPEEKVQIVKALQGVQQDIDQILQQQCFDIQKVMTATREKLQAFYDRRAALVSGSAAPKDEEVSAAPADTRLEKPAEEGEEEAKTFRIETAKKRAAAVADGPGLPNFWGEVIRNHDGFEQMINENDVEVLKDLVHVDSIQMPEPHLGFVVRFVFRASKFIKAAEVVYKGPTVQENVAGPCPALDATIKKLVDAGPISADIALGGLTVPEGGFVLVKAYYMEPDQDGDQVAVAIDGTNIEWTDMDPTVRIQEKKQTKGKGAKKQVRVVKTEVPVPSFFRMFRPVSPEDGPEQNDDEMGPQEDESPFDNDFELGRALSGTLIPRAIEWFTRRAPAPDSGFDGDDEEDEDHQGDDGEDDEDAPAGGAGGQKPECKQQ